MLSKSKARNKQWAVAIKNSIQTYRPFLGFRQNTGPRSTDPLLTPYEINRKMKIKKAQNYKWDPIQVLSKSVLKQIIDKWAWFCISSKTWLQKSLT